MMQHIIIGENIKRQNAIIPLINLMSYVIFLACIKGDCKKKDNTNSNINIIISKNNITLRALTSFLKESKFPMILPLLLVNTSCLKDTLLNFEKKYIEVIRVTATAGSVAPLYKTCIICSIVPTVNTIPKKNIKFHKLSLLSRVLINCFTVNTLKLLGSYPYIISQIITITKHKNIKFCDFLKNHIIEV